MAISLVINPSGPLDTVGASTTNSIVVNAVFRGLPASQDFWIVFSPADKISSPDRIYVSSSQVIGGETTLQIFIEPIEGTHTIHAFVNKADNSFLAEVEDSIVLDLPDFQLVINNDDPITTSTFVTLKITNIPPGEFLWVLFDQSQVIAPRSICFDGYATASGEIIYSTQLRGSTNGVRKVDITLYQDGPYAFWGTASDTINLNLPPLADPIVVINPTGPMGEGEAYTRFLDAYVNVSNLTPLEPVYITLFEDLISPTNQMFFDSADTATGTVPINISLIPGFSSGPPYEDGYRLITAAILNLEQQEAYGSDSIILDTTPPIISFIPDSYGSTIAGVPGSVSISTNEPAVIFYQIIDPFLFFDSYTEDLSVDLPDGYNSITIDAYAIDLAGNISDIYTNTFELSLFGARFKRFGAVGTDAYLDDKEIFSTTDNIGQTILYPSGRPQDDYIHELPDVNAPDPLTTPSLIGDPSVGTWNVNVNLHQTLNRNAKVFDIDTRKEMPVPIIMRPHGSLRDINKSGFIGNDVRSLEPYISGGFVRAFHGPNGLRNSYYFDSNSTQWIRNITTIKPLTPLRLFDGYTGRSRFVFSWIPFKGSKLI